MRQPTWSIAVGKGVAWVAVVATVVPLFACQANPNASLEEALNRVTGEVLDAHVSVLAHDSMRGRDTNDVGFEKARDYVAREFARIGLEPIEASSYLQPFELLEVVADEGSDLVVGSEQFGWPEVHATPDWRGETPVIEGEGVFVGHALVADGFAGDLGGKIAFVLAGVPDGQADDPQVAMRDRAENELALRRGAVGVVVLNPDATERGWSARSNPRRPRRVLANGSSVNPQALATVGPAASRRIMEAFDGADVIPVRLTRRHELRTVQSWNVGGVLPGSGADGLAEEVVVFTAHLDHVGIGAPDAQGDSIYNGTHDNALGVAKVLAVAEALKATSPRRSVLFLATGAEESGLLGAWYYVNNPVIPIERTAAAINHDGGLVNGRTDDVFAWGPEFSSVLPSVEQAANLSGLELSDAKRDPFGPSAGLLYRSDHYPFLISGVPVVYLMPGFTVDGDSERGRQAWLDYLGGVHHVQADNYVEGASYEAPVALTRMSIRLAWDLANAAEMPAVHDDAVVVRERGAPTGFFFSDEGVRR